MHLETLANYWIDCKQELPPLPEDPFKVYLVWAVQNIDGATGTTYLWQFSRDGRGWVPFYEPRNGTFGTITHWSKALDLLGYPDPQPFGPRGFGKPSACPHSATP